MIIIQKCHEFLGIEVSASEKQIKKAYRKLAKKIHPDTKRESEKEEAHKKFIELSEHYETALKLLKNHNQEHFQKKNQEKARKRQKQEPKREEKQQKKYYDKEESQPSFEQARKSRQDAEQRRKDGYQKKREEQQKKRAEEQQTYEQDQKRHAEEKQKYEQEQKRRAEEKQKYEQEQKRIKEEIAKTNDVQHETKEKLSEFSFLKAEGEAIKDEFITFPDNNFHELEKKKLFFRKIIVGPRLNFIGLINVNDEEVWKGKIYKFIFKNTHLNTISCFQNGKRAKFPVSDAEVIEFKLKSNKTLEIFYKVMGYNRIEKQIRLCRKRLKGTIWGHELDLEFNDRGSVSAYSINEEPILDLNGAFKTKWVYRKPGNFFNIYLDENDNQTEDNRGVFTTKWNYNQQKNIISKIYIERAGELKEVESFVNSKDLISTYHTENWEFDPDGRVKCWNVMRNNPSTTETHKISNIVWKYDSKGRVINLKFSGLDSQPRNDSNGVSHYEWDYDKNDNIFSRKMTCKNGNKIEEWKIGIHES